MTDNKLTITLKDGKVGIKSVKPIAIYETIELTLKALLSAMNQTVAAVPDEHKDAVKENLYELLNVAASNTLAIFAPEIEMRPDLTVQAILEKENELIFSGRAPALKVPKY